MIQKRLTFDEIHIWCAKVDSSADILHGLKQVLSIDELARAGRFHFQKDQERYIFAHGLLRILLGRYTNSLPHLIQFRHGNQGKPYLAHSMDGEKLRFNMSHSGEIVLYGITRSREIGVDVEQIRPRKASLAMAERFFSDLEVERLKSLPTSQHLEGFFNCWTRKEAYIKAIGKGMAQPLDAFAVSLAPGEPAALIWSRDKPEEVNRWSMATLDLGLGYAGAVAAEGQDWQLKIWSVNEDVFLEVI